MDSHTSTTTKSPEETTQLAYILADTLKQNRQKGSGSSATIVCLYGPLGSGKTTFAQGFAKGLGITRRLLSPTFIIVRHYQLEDKKTMLYHLDLYRLSPTDLSTLGIADMLADPNAYVLIEWAEKFGNLLPSQRIDVHCEALDDGSHQIVIKKLT